MESGFNSETAGENERFAVGKKKVWGFGSPYSEMQLFAVSPMLLLSWLGWCNASAEFWFVSTNRRTEVAYKKQVKRKA